LALPVNATQQAGALWPWRAQQSDRLDPTAPENRCWVEPGCWVKVRGARYWRAKRAGVLAIADLPSGACRCWRRGSRPPWCRLPLPGVWRLL